MLTDHTRHRLSDALLCMPSNALNVLLALGDGVRGARRERWEEFLANADGNNVWPVMT